MRLVSVLVALLAELCGLPDCLTVVSGPAESRFARVTYCWHPVPTKRMLIWGDTGGKVPCWHLRYRNPVSYISFMLHLSYHPGVQLQCRLHLRVTPASLLLLFVHPQLDVPLTLMTPESVGLAAVVDRCMCCGRQAACAEVLQLCAQLTPARISQCSTALHLLPVLLCLVANGLALACGFICVRADA